MGNAMMLYPNRADPPAPALPGASITGPVSALPLSNMQLRRSSKVWRSIDADPANTQFVVRLNRRTQIKALSLIRTNLTTTASYRVTAWYDGEESDPVFTGTFDVFPSTVFTEDADWDDENWWDGKPLSEEVDGLPINATLVLPEFVSAPNWRVEIIDPNNPDEYVQVTRLFMAGGWQPSSNYNYGGAHGLGSNTKIEESLSGEEFFDPRRTYRTVMVGFDYLDELEALLKGMEMARRAGLHGEILWIADPSNPRIMPQTCFLARITDFPAWEQVVYLRANFGIKLKELF